MKPATASAKKEMIRAKEFVARSKAAADPYDQSSWAILYGALAGAFGNSPDNFQLVYPHIAWDWPTETSGYIGTNAYDALSTIPQWSAIGKYTSSGERFNDQYQAFLNVIDPATDDPDLRGRIERANNVLVEATNQYDRTLSQATTAYNAAVPGGQPTFTEWMGTPGGRAWKSKLEAYDTALASAQAVYTSLVEQTTTPNLTEALAAYADKQWYSKLNDPNLGGFPSVPNYSTGVTSAAWRDRVERGEVPGGSISIANSDKGYDFSKSWAKGSTSVGTWFWEVKVSGSWEQISEFRSDSNLSASINFKGVQTIGVQPSGWYKGVSNLADGPYKRGYSKYGSGNTTAVFGQGGFLPLLKSGMLVAAGMTFTISVDESTFAAFSQKFKAATGLRIGPFTFSADGGSERAGWRADSRGTTFTGTSTSTVPQIFGWTLNVLP